MVQYRERGNVKSAERALAILEYFDLQPDGVTVKEVSQGLGIPQSSTTMLLRSLLDLGYVTRLPGTRRFVPGARTAFIGSGVRGRMEETFPLREFVDRMAHDLRETVVVGTQQGPWLQYVYVSSAKPAAQIHPRVGMKRLMTCTAAGRALLTHNPEKRVRLIARHNNAHAGAGLQMGERELFDELERIRRQGFSESCGRLIPGIHNISVTTSIGAVPTPLVVGVGGPAEHMRDLRERVIDTLVTRFAPVRC